MAVTFVGTDGAIVSDATVEVAVVVEVTAGTAGEAGVAGTAGTVPETGGGIAGVAGIAGIVPDGTEIMDVEVDAITIGAVVASASDNKVVSEAVVVEKNGAVVPSFFRIPGAWMSPEGIFSDDPAFWVSRVLIRARVRGPTMPMDSMPWRSWNLRTAASVLGP